MCQKKNLNFTTRDHPGQVYTNMFVNIVIDIVLRAVGGQNVNKVNTKAELRLHVMSANWIPDEVKKRLISQEKNKVNQDGVLVLTSQEQR